MYKLTEYLYHIYLILISSEIILLLTVIKWFISLYIVETTHLTFLILNSDIISFRIYIIIWIIFFLNTLKIIKPTVVSYMADLAHSIVHKHLYWDIHPHYQEPNLAGNSLFYFFIIKCVFYFIIIKCNVSAAC